MTTVKFSQLLHKDMIAKILRIVLRSWYDKNYDLE